MSTLPPGLPNGRRRQPDREGFHPLQLKAQAVADLFDVLDAYQRGHLVEALDELADAAAASPSPDDPATAPAAAATARA